MFWQLSSKENSHDFEKNSIPSLGPFVAHHVRLILSSLFSALFAWRRSRRRATFGRRRAARRVRLCLSFARLAHADAAAEFRQLLHARRVRDRDARGAQR